MTDPELVGYDDTHERKLYVLSVANPGELPQTIRLASRRFACLVAWNADNVSNSDIAAVAHVLLNSGAVYLSVWGKECERVHDIIDEVSVGPCPPPVLEKVVMTTWHADEPLDEAIWHSLHCSWPDQAYEQGCDATLALSIGLPDAAQRIRFAFCDSHAFTSSVSGE